MVVSSPPSAWTTFQVSIIPSHLLQSGSCSGAAINRAWNIMNSDFVNSLDRFW